MVDYLVGRMNELNQSECSSSNRFLSVVCCNYFVGKKRNIFQVRAELNNNHKNNEPLLKTGSKIELVLVTWPKMEPVYTFKEQNVNLILTEKKSSRSIIWRNFEAPKLEQVEGAEICKLHEMLALIKITGPESRDPLSTVLQIVKPTLQPLWLETEKEWIAVEADKKKQENLLRLTGNKYLTVVSCDISVKDKRKSKTASFEFCIEVLNDYVKCTPFFSSNTLLECKVYTYETEELVYSNFSPILLKQDFLLQKPPHKNCLWIHENLKTKFQHSLYLVKITASFEGEIVSELEQVIQLREDPQKQIKVPLHGWLVRIQQKN